MNKRIIYPARYLPLGFSFLSLILFLTSCSPGPRPDSPIPTISPSAATPTALPSPLSTPFISSTTTAIYLTATQDGDNRVTSYIFPEDINPTTDQVIRLGLENRLRYSPNRGKRFLSYVLLQPPEVTDDGAIIVYLYLRANEYIPLHGALIQGGGLQMPASLWIKEESQGWQVQLETAMRPSSGWNPGEILPENVLPLIRNLPAVVSARINDDIIQQAENYYGLPFDAEKSKYPRTPTPTSAIRILTLTPTPTIDLSAIEPDVSADSLVSGGLITITVNLYQGITRDFQKGLVSGDWHVYLYSRQPDGKYNGAAGVLLDPTKHYHSSWGTGPEFKVSLLEADIPQLLGDSRGLVYQVIDGAGQVHWQDEIYLATGLSYQFTNDDLEYADDLHSTYLAGVFIGKPNLMSVETAPTFAVEGDQVTILEPEGGFHSLTFEFDLYRSTGVSGMQEMIALVDNLKIELTPQEDSEQLFIDRRYSLSGQLLGGGALLGIEFPHSWLDQQRTDTQAYQLTISDQTGLLNKSVLIHFRPSNQIN